ncbi:hypothetical protein CRG98_018551 [Punica granatum]|uniref:Uncharacterized protein n=1 Tax=Punica granatum TaxID=22663 RepID=A0A2I0K021_PUNGR|nr:hypothetical protein CRG98_018551 [Punica granatum]
MADPTVNSGSGSAEPSFDMLVGLWPRLLLVLSLKPVDQNGVLIVGDTTSLGPFPVELESVHLLGDTRRTHMKRSRHLPFYNPKVKGRPYLECDGDSRLDPIPHSGCTYSVNQEALDLVHCGNKRCTAFHEKVHAI